YLRDLDDADLQGLIDMQQEPIARAQARYEAAQRALAEAQREYNAAIMKLREKTEAPAMMVDEQARREYARHPRRAHNFIEPERGIQIFIKEITGRVHTIRVNPETTYVGDVITMLQNKFPALRAYNNPRLIARGAVLPPHRLIKDYELKTLECIYLVWSRPVEAPEEE
ncbi:hypothetical protein EBR77_03860, partial [bacterium]|nr:hypothetical protein [bacterium]